MRKRVGAWLAIVMTMSLGACGHGRGENVSYALWNRNGNHGIENCGLFATDGHGGRVWLAMSPRADPLPRGEAGWQVGGRAFLPDMNHRVPERMYVAWLGGGRSEGPFAIELRAQIPDDVLKKIRGSVRYELQIGVGAGLNPPTVRWQLLESVPERIGSQVIQRGGDW